MCVCFFFFFKQKTAYEMRISDWSSDVCSSDLYERAAQLHPTLQLRVEPDRMRGAARRQVDERHSIRHRQLPPPDRCGLAAVERDHPQEIGRASCRERVCQYV